jgi:hypothetical protein
MTNTFGKKGLIRCYRFYCLCTLKARAGWDSTDPAPLKSKRGKKKKGTRKDARINANKNFSLLAIQNQSIAQLYHLQNLLESYNLLDLQQNL